jgi:hypothetical protein
MPVAKYRRWPAHPSVGLWVQQKPLDVPGETVRGGSHQLNIASLEPLRAFRVPPEYEHGLAQDGRLFLHAA